MIAGAAILSLLLLSCLAIPVQAQNESTYSIGFDGSVQNLAPGETGNVIVHVNDGPAGNYSWNASMSGGTVSPVKGQGSAQNFTLAVTAPTTTGDITLTVLMSNGTVNTTARYTIHVINPVVITAQVKNSGNLALQNVSVQFVADGVVVNTSAFNIPANATKTLTYNWTAGSLSNGQHTIGMVLDSDNQYVRFIDGSTTYNTKFYVGDSGFGLINILLIIVVVLLALILFFTFMNRGRKKRT